jgi:hypothetical protein
LDGRVDEDRLKRHDLTDDEWVICPELSGQLIYG